jgi:threonine aldolase
MRSFASDNHAGVHPAIIKAIEHANIDHAIAYGDDDYTMKAKEIFKEIFGKQTDVYLVFNGTGANVTALTCLTQAYNSIICAESAHINVDECGAPEKASGCKLLAIPTTDGKLTTDSIKKHLHGFDFEHHAQPKVISISQPTELGTVYTVEEIKAITDLAHSFNLLVHMDGARISNAAVALNKSFREFTVDAGIDALSFGGTKNGMMYGEALLFFNPQQSINFKYIRKQGMQLASKMRYISAQFIAMIEQGLWKNNAVHANEMAILLASKIQQNNKVEIMYPVQTNAVFVRIPKDSIIPLQKKHFFYVWNEHENIVRWMTSFDTTKEDIEGFVKTINELLV